jgi:RNA polymerase sigma-70 factor (ECF subfamily)
MRFVPVHVGDDGALVDGLRQADTRAFEAVFHQHQKGLYGFLRRLTRNDAVALELTQETWLKLAAEAPWLAPDTALRAWLFTVARNLFLSHRRWSLLDGSRLAELFEGSRGRVDAHTPEDRAQAAQAQVHLERAFERLPLKDREALALVAGEGLEPQEAAQVLGISAEAFRQRLSRARERLRAMMEEKR